MTFLSPAWLLAAFLAIPVILLHARLRRRIEVASVQLWRLVGPGLEGRRTLRRPPLSLLLVLQLAAVFLLAIALAQPRFGSAADDAGHVVFLLDSSGSMQATDVAGGSRFEAARNYIADAVRRIGPGEARISVVAVGAAPRIAVARQADAEGILPILLALRAEDGAAAWAAAPEALVPIRRADEATRLVLVSDDAAGAVAAFAEPGVEAVSFGTAAVANRSLAATVARKDDGTWTVSGTVRFSGMAPAATELAVLFGPNGDTELLDFGTIAVALPPSAADASTPAELPFQTELKLPGEGSLMLRLPDDAGPHDNAAQFRVRTAERAARILVVGDGDTALQRALAATEAAEVFQSATLPADADSYDLVVVDDVAIARKPATNVLWVERGRVESETAPEPLADAYITGWDAAHPLSAGANWGALAAPRAFAVPALPGASIVVEAAGSPLLQARTTPDGREVRLALAAEASSWANETSYPVFVSALVAWLGIDTGTAAPPPCVVGTFCRLESRLVGAAVTTPDGATLPGAAAGDAAWLPADIDAGFVPPRAGLYRAADARGSHVVAVNRAGHAESDLAATAADSRPSFSGLSGRPWWLLVLVLAVLAAETWLAGRGAERFLRPGALRRDAPYAQRRRWHLSLRLAALAALVAALIPLALPKREPANHAVLVLSEPLPGGQPDPARIALMAAVNAGGTAPAQVGLVSAGARPHIGRDLGAGEAKPTPPDSAIGADFGDAVQLAVAMLPGDRPGRIVVAGDGNVTGGSLADAAATARARAVPVDTVTLAGMPAAEVLVAAVEIPPTVYAGERFTVNAFVHSAGAGEADVDLLRDGTVVSTQHVTLAAGSNRIEAVFDSIDAGEALIEVAVRAPADTIAGNNRDGAIVTATAPRVLIVTPDVERGDFFARALAVQGLAAEVIAADAAPSVLSRWLTYDLFVLMNMPAIDLTVDQQRMLADAVETHGRGLLLLGGEHAFGPGGYFQTDLDRISPLSARVPQDEPGAALMFVLDRSGSMQARVEDVNRLTIAKGATVQAISLLHPDSQVGVIVFDSEPHVIVPIKQGVDLPAIEAALAPVEPGGGTKLYPGLAEAITQLSTTDALAKHIVVMTDGLLELADFPGLLAQASEAGITVSAVAIGGGADVIRAEAIARIGGGAFHATQDFRALPSILSQEAMMMSGSPVEVGSAPVFWIDRKADFLAGLPDQLPPLENYVRTTARPTATLHLATRDADGEVVPITASWRYGNGRVLAFASHGAGSGTQNWLAMPDYPRLWGQIVRHFLPGSAGPGLHAAASRAGDAIRLAVDALDKDGAPQTGATVTADAGTGAAPIILREAAAGRYVGTIDNALPGTHHIAVTMGDEAANAAVHVGYPARLKVSRADPSTLAPLAFVTGGTANAAEPLAAAAESRWALRPTERPWVVLALALFLIDLAVRYAPGLARLRRRAPRQEAAAAA